jgi:hypothetical protein
MSERDEAIDLAAAGPPALPGFDERYYLGLNEHLRSHIKLLSARLRSLGGGVPEIPEFPGTIVAGSDPENSTPVALSESAADPLTEGSAFPNGAPPESPTAPEPAPIDPPPAEGEPETASAAPEPSPVA